MFGYYKASRVRSEPVTKNAVVVAECFPVSATLASRATSIDICPSKTTNTQGTQTVLSLKDLSSTLDETRPLPARPDDASPDEAEEFAMLWDAIRDDLLSEIVMESKTPPPGFRRIRGITRVRHEGIMSLRVVSQRTPFTSTRGICFSFGPPLQKKFEHKRRR